VKKMSNAEQGIANVEGKTASEAILVPSIFDIPCSAFDISSSIADNFLSIKEIELPAA